MTDQAFETPVAHATAPPGGFEPAPRTSHLDAVVSRIARAFAGELSTGDLAELRRLPPGDPSAVAFWKVASACLRPAGYLLASGESLARDERAWGALLASFAHLPPHHPGTPLGVALARAEMSELRFVRLLRAREEALLYAVRNTARFLAAKAIGTNWTDLARLVLSDSAVHAEEVRRNIARHYFGTLGRTE